MLRTETCEKFIEILASDAPAPGGGSVSSLCGSMAASLMSMVCRLSERKEGADKLAPILGEVLGLKDQLLVGVDTDAEAFFEVMAGFGMPKGTPEEKEARTAAIQAGYKTAISVPMGTAEKCLRIAGLGLEILKIGFNENAASDLGVGLECSQTGFSGAIMNVSINLPSVKDAEYLAAMGKKREQMGEEMKKIMDEARGLLSRIIK
jgi:formiminotetrahydrofolate cyclodeaminase